MDGELIMNIAMGVGIGLAVATVPPLLVLLPLYFVTKWWERREIDREIERLQKG